MSAPIQLEQVSSYMMETMGQAGNGKLRRCAWLFNGFSYKLKTNGSIEFFATSPKLQEGHFKKTVIARNEATWRSMKLYV